MNIYKWAACVAMGLSVAACGGGGDDGNSAAAVTATRNAATDGIAISFFTGGAVVADWGIIASTVARLSFYPGSAQGIDINNLCLSGSASADIAKAGTDAGFAAGDKVAISFRKCAISSTFSMDGSIGATILTPHTPPAGASYAIQIRFEPRTFSASDGAMQRRYLGSMDFSLTSASGIFDSVLSIPAGGTLTAEISGNTRLIYSYVAGTTYRGSDTSTTFSRKLDGTISVAPFGTPAATLTIATPTAFAGTVSSNSPPIASNGVLNVVKKVGGSGVSAAVAVGGAKVKVDGDVNLDGAVDVSFDTTWSELLGL